MLAVLGINGGFLLAEMAFDYTRVRQVDFYHHGADGVHACL